jgi:hypothetical protein
MFPCALLILLEKLKARTQIKYHLKANNSFPDSLIERLLCLKHTSKQSYPWTSSAEFNDKVGLATVYWSETH